MEKLENDLKGYKFKGNARAKRSAYGLSPKKLFCYILDSATQVIIKQIS